MIWRLLIADNRSFNPQAAPLPRELNTAPVLGGTSVGSPCTQLGRPLESNHNAQSECTGKTILDLACRCHSHSRQDAFLRCPWHFQTSPDMMGSEGLGKGTLVWWKWGRQNVQSIGPKVCSKQATGVCFNGESWAKQNCPGTRGLKEKESQAKPKNLPAQASDQYQGVLQFDLTCSCNLTPWLYEFGCWSTPQGRSSNILPVAFVLTVGHLICRTSLMDLPWPVWTQNPWRTGRSNKDDADTNCCQMLCFQLKQI